jgi:hypothetical protein
MFSKQEILEATSYIPNSSSDIEELYQKYNNDIIWIYYYNNQEIGDIFVISFYVSSKGDILFTEWFLDEDKSEAIFFVIERRINHPFVELSIDEDKDLYLSKISVEDGEDVLIKLIDNRLKKKIRNYENKQFL